MFDNDGVVINDGSVRCDRARLIIRALRATDAEFVGCGERDRERDRECERDCDRNRANL